MKTEVMKLGVWQKYYTEALTVQRWMAQGGPCRCCCSLEVAFASRVIDLSREERQLRLWEITVDEFTLQGLVPLPLYLFHCWALPTPFLRLGCLANLFHYFSQLSKLHEQREKVEQARSAVKEAMKKWNECLQRAK